MGAWWGRNHGHTTNVLTTHKEFKIYFLIPSNYAIVEYTIQTLQPTLLMDFFFIFTWVDYKRNQNESESHKLENNWRPRCSGDQNSESPAPQSCNSLALSWNGKNIKLDIFEMTLVDLTHLWLQSTTRLHSVEIWVFYLTAFEIAISLVSYRHVTQCLNVNGRRPGRPRECRVTICHLCYLWTYWELHPANSP